MHRLLSTRRLAVALAAFCLPALIARAQSAAESQFTSFLNMGARLIEIHEPGKAVGFYAKCANFLPERHESYREMSRTLLGMGEKEEAAFWWREAKRRAPSDPALAEIRAQFPAGMLDDSTTGKVAKIELRYLGRAATDARGGDGGSIDAGQGINPALLFAQGFDSTGHAVAGFKPEWTGVSGTKATPSTGEKIVARDAASGATAEVAVRVVGKATSIRLYDVPTRKELKEALYIAPNEKRSIRVNAQDAAGNTLALKEYRWSAEKDAKPTPEVLQTDQTYASPEFPFEPVANVFRAPDVKSPTPFGIVVTDPATGARGRAEVVVTPNAEKLAALGKRNWIDRFEDALAAAELQGKLAMVDFQAPWCPWCRRLEAGPLADDRVIAKEKSFVTAKINNDERPDLVDLYRVADIPQILFFTADGVLVERLKEMADVDTPEHLMAAMDRAIKKADDVLYKEKELRVATDNDPENALAWKALGDFYEERNQFKGAIEAYLRARDLAVENDEHRIVEPITFELTYMELVLRHYDASLEESAYYLKAFADSKRLDQIYLYRGYAFFYKKSNDEAQKVLKEQIEKFPQSPFNANAQEILDVIASGGR